MRGMDWLRHGSGAPVDLATDVQALQALAHLASTLTEQALAGNRDLSSLLSAVAHSTEAAASVAALLPPKLVPAWQQLVRTLDAERAAALGGLGCPLGDLGTERCPGTEAALRWQLLGTVATGATQGVPAPSAPLCLLASSDLVQGLRFEVEPDADADEGWVIALSLAGAVDAALDFGVPIRIGRIGADAELEAAYRVRYRWSSDPQTPAAAQLARSIAALVSPFDLYGLMQAMADGPLRSVETQTTTALGLSGSMLIGRGMDLVDGSAVTLGLDISASGSRGTALRMRTQLSQASPEPVVLLDISRGESQWQGTSAELGVSLEPGPALRRSAAWLADEGGESGELMRGLTDLLPISEYLRHAVLDGVEALAARVPEPAATFGPEGQKGLVQGLLQALDAADDIWTADPTDLAERLATRAVSASSLVRQSLELEPALRALSARLVADLQQTFAERVAELPEPPRDAGGWWPSGWRLFEAFGGNTAASDLATGRREWALERLQAGQRLLRRLAGGIQRAARAKLEARLRRGELDFQEGTLEQRLRLYPLRSGAQLMYEQLALGAIEDAQRTYQRFTDVPVGAPPAEWLDGSIGEVAGIERSRVAEVLVLDLALSDATLFDADVELELDQAGNLTVLARTASSRWLRGFGEARRVRAVNVYELGAAQRTGRMTYSLAVSHREEDFQDSEVRSFFAALEAEGLLAQGTAEEAIGHLDAALGSDAAALKRRGELRVWLELDEPGLRRLLQVESPAQGSAGNPLDGMLVYSAAVRAILAGQQRTGAAATLNNLRHFVRTQGTDADLETVLMRMASPVYRRRWRPHGSTAAFGGPMDDFRLLERMSDRCLGLVRMVEAMREILFASLGRSGRAWRAEDYLARQSLLDEHTASWLRGDLFDRGFSAFVSEALRPYTLALFLALDALSRAGTAPSRMQAALFLDDLDGGRVLSLSGSGASS